MRRIARDNHGSTYVVTRRGRILSVVLAAAVFSAAVVILPGQLGWGQPSRHSQLKSISIQWPSSGEAAIAVVGAGHRSSTPVQQVAIASVAKVMTAYVVLRGFPLSGDSPGFTMTFTDADAAQAAADKSQGQSYVPVQAGEVMTERQALQALLLPSANNIAVALAEHVAGSVSGFVQAMNVEARSLGMHRTVYTDPSGLAETTVSTAPDQLRLARAAMRNPTFAQIVGMRQATIPVAGTVANTDSLVGRDGFMGIKTGSDDAAGGCFMFMARRIIHGRSRTVLGVVLGQRDGPFIRAGLNAAQRLVDGVMGQLAVAATSR